ncbi:hypothetical protein RYA05_03310 [Pseudomonas syringae pv. actinidiae]|nr:hypothetical protein [Pseudomonas syringae pv. actinidiae]
MDIKALRELKPLQAALLTFITLAAIVATGIAIRYLVPFLWDMTYIAARAVWSVFVYWDQKSSYCGAVASFLTIWAGITSLVLTFNEQYFRECRYALLTTLFFSMINTLFFIAAVAASNRGELSFWMSINLITSFIFPFIAISMLVEHWKPKKKIVTYRE